MTLFAACTFFGGGTGPLISGFVSDHSSWRWIFYIQCILIAVAVAVMTISFEETRANVLLEQNCHMINAELERVRKIPEQSNKNSSLATLEFGSMLFTVIFRKNKSLLGIMLGEHIVSAETVGDRINCLLVLGLGDFRMGNFIHAIQQHPIRVQIRLRLLELEGRIGVSRSHVGRSRGLSRQCLAGSFPPQALNLVPVKPRSALVLRLRAWIVVADWPFHVWASQREPSFHGSYRLLPSCCSSLASFLSI